jgi:peptidoglycan/xylan/chitin deacetylase (PgdA/CDA1 family)
MTSGAARIRITTSWDDGHVLDDRLAHLLEAYALPATFYIAPRNVEIPPEDRLDVHGLRALAERFEIGGHTLRHLRLPTLDDDDARAEIRDGKHALEDAIGLPVDTFCYPAGRYQAQHVAMVRDEGFRVARTVRRHETGTSAPLEMATTMHTYRHLVDGPTAALLAGLRPVRTGRFYWNWDEMAMALFDKVLAVGGIYHLWGHSWEIDDHGDWARLERVFAYISGRAGVEYVTNGELVDGRP